MRDSLRPYKILKNPAAFAPKCFREATNSPGRMVLHPEKDTSFHNEFALKLLSWPPHLLIRPPTSGTSFPREHIKGDTQPLSAKFPATFKRSVDFQFPGLPPIKINEAGTIPPPRTRSNSLLLELNLLKFSSSILVIETAFDLVDEF